jgi:hypothetical protein
VTMKYVITRDIIKASFVKKNINKRLLIFLTASSLLLFAIPDFYNLFSVKKVYVTRIVPNVWHNSTLISLTPFAILLFWKQYQVLSAKDSPGTKSIFIIFLLMLVNVLIKPSFFFVFAPITTLFLFFRYRFSRHFFINFIPILLTSGVVLILHQLIFILNTHSDLSHKNSVILTPLFHVWSHIIPAWYIPFALVMSFLLPITWFILYRKRLMIDRKLLQYALWMMVVALLISGFVAEEGSRHRHMNFFAQNVICCYLLNLVVISDAVKRYSSSQIFDARMKIFSLAFIAHLVTGILYLALMFYRGYYY